MSIHACVRFTDYCNWKNSQEIGNNSRKILLLDNYIATRQETTEICTLDGICLFNVCNVDGNRLEDNSDKHKISIDSAIIKIGGEFSYVETTLLHVPVTLILSMNL